MNRKHVLGNIAGFGLGRLMTRIYTYAPVTRHRVTDGGSESEPSDVGVTLVLLPPFVSVISLIFI